MNTQAGDVIEREDPAATAVYKGYEEYDFQNDSDFRVRFKSIGHSFAMTVRTANYHVEITGIKA